MKILFIFPTTLFKNIKFDIYDKVICIEEPRYYTDFQYHKLKLVYHTTTLSKYYHSIQHKNKEYVCFFNAHLIYKKYKSDECYGYTLYDYTIESKIKKQNPDFQWINSLNFLNTRDEFEQITLKRHSAFYNMQRKRFNILLNSDGTPIGGSFSFDAENRTKLESYDVKKMPEYESSKEVINYINKHFPNNYGECDVMYYPTTHDEAIKALKHFIKYDLLNFTFEDAIYKPNDDTIENAKLFHSMLSPMLNVGLLTDADVMFYMNPILTDLTKKFKDKPASYIKESKYFQLLCSVEGFIRQIIGWRQYMLYIYINNPMIKKENFMKFTKSIPKKLYWTATTGVVVVDDVIKKILKYAYAHHIERLMILSNFMFINEYKPIDVYGMFMCWTIDAYDWVMTSNIFTMCQFSTGTSYTTKPYFSSSAYILKMSNYKRGDWCIKWDTLYRDFKRRNKVLDKYIRRPY